MTREQGHGMISIQITRILGPNNNYFIFNQLVEQTLYIFTKLNVTSPIQITSKPYRKLALCMKNFALDIISVKLAKNIKYLFTMMLQSFTEHLSPVQIFNKVQ